MYVVKGDLIEMSNYGHDNHSFLSANMCSNL